MRLTQTFRDMVIKAIKDDGSLQIDEQDWWTSFTDPKGRVYDVNVYGDEYADIPPDEFRVAVYDVLEIEGEYITDHENHLVVFAVMRDAVVDIPETKTYRVSFWYTVYGSTFIEASSPEEAKKLINADIEQNDLDGLQHSANSRMYDACDAREIE